MELYQTWFQDRPPETPGLTLVTEVVELVGPERPLENCQEDIICWNFKEENFQACKSSKHIYIYKSTEILPFPSTPRSLPLPLPFPKRWYDKSGKISIDESNGGRGEQAPQDSWVSIKQPRLQAPPCIQPKPSYENRKVWRYIVTLTKTSWINRRHRHPT